MGARRWTRFRSAGLASAAGSTTRGVRCRIYSRLVDEPAASVTLLVPHWHSQPWWPVLMRVASAYEVVTVPDGAAVPSALARDMGIAPEITRVRGRAGNMALVHVPFRAGSGVIH